jgi:hypothetical protein
MPPGHYEKAVKLIESDFHSWAMLVMCYQAQGNREGVLRGAQMMHSQAEKVLPRIPAMARRWVSAQAGMRFSEIANWQWRRSNARC